MQFVDYLLHPEHVRRKYGPFACVNANALIFVGFATFHSVNAYRCQ